MGELAEPIKTFRGYLSGRIYYAKRVGWRWQVWHSYQDGEPDPVNGATEWLSCPNRYFRWINAARAAQAMWCAFNDGVWCEQGRKPDERMERLRAALDGRSLPRPGNAGETKP